MSLISVILTTYNRPDALKVVLECYQRQTDTEFEIIIADDGSGEETRDVITSMAAESSIPIIHSWQPDEGFRVALSRNLALTKAKGDYIIFSDGDCCVLPDFVLYHRRLAQQGYFVTGKRSFLHQEITHKILKNGFKGGRLAWLLHALAIKCNRPFEFFPLPLNQAWRYKMPTDSHQTQTCNLGVWKQDIFMINGFDNQFIDHGGEDTDLVLRLINGGIKRKLASHTSPVIHLYHKRQSSVDSGKAYKDKAFEALRQDNVVKVRNGLNELFAA